MLKKRVYVSLIIIFGFVIHLNAQSEGESVAIRRSEVVRIKSSINNLIYPVYIALPANYKQSNESYPVVYMLDAYSSFGIMVQLQRLLLFNKELPEVIIVGISSEGGSKEFNYNRSRDYTPTHIQSDSIPALLRSMIPASGGADDFISFIKNDLIKQIESKYRCNPNDRTIVGHSLGGLFGFYVLFTNPELFQNYVLISPALNWDKEFILKLEEKFSLSHKTLLAKIYTTVGSLEGSIMIQPWQRLVDSIKKHNYSGLSIEVGVSEKETHYTIIPYIATHGLKSVFAK